MKRIGPSASLLVSGVRKHGDETQVTIDDKFHLGSNTKAMTATLIAIFIEQGKIRWDRPIIEIFPEFGSTLHADYQGLTIEMLAAHRSGITGDLLGFEGGILWEIANDSSKDVITIRKDASRAVLSSRPESKPHSKFIYSNMNYIILGAVLERIAGRSWEDLTRLHLFGPLHMPSCGFGAAGDPLANPPDQPWGHRKSANSWTAIPPGPAGDNPPALGPAGTVHCSMRDWGRFLQVHIDGFNGLDSAILKAKSYEKLHTPYPGQEYTFGGWARLERPWADGVVLTHEGSNGYNYSAAWLAPRKNLLILSVTNSGEGSEAADEAIAQLIKSPAP